MWMEHSKNQSILIRSLLSEHRYRALTAALIIYAIALLNHISFYTIQIANYL